jgi:hypothetical protein
MQQHGLKKISAIEKSAAINSTSLSNPKNSTGKASLYIDRQSAKPLSPDKLAPAGDTSIESNTRKDALKATPSNEIHRGKSIGSRAAAA